MFKGSLRSGRFYCWTVLLFEQSWVTRCALTAIKQHRDTDNSCRVQKSILCMWNIFSHPSLDPCSISDLTEAGCLMRCCGLSGFVMCLTQTWLLVGNWIVRHEMYFWMYGDAYLWSAYHSSSYGFSTIGSFFTAASVVCHSWGLFNLINFTTDRNLFPNERALHHNYFLIRLFSRHYQENIMFLPGVSCRTYTWGSRTTVTMDQTTCSQTDQLYLSEVICAAKTAHIRSEPPF